MRRRSSGGGIITDAVVYGGRRSARPRMVSWAHGLSVQSQQMAAQCSESRHLPRLRLRAGDAVLGR